MKTKKPIFEYDDIDGALWTNVAIENVTKLGIASNDWFFVADDMTEETARILCRHFKGRFRKIKDE